MCNKYSYIESYFNFTASMKSARISALSFFLPSSYCTVELTSQPDILCWVTRNLHNRCLEDRASVQLPHLCGMDFSTFTLRTVHRQYKRGLVNFYYYYVLYIYINLVFDENSADPDQTPRSAVSDMSLHCLPVSFLWDARHEISSLFRLTHFVLLSVLNTSGLAHFFILSLKCPILALTGDTPKAEGIPVYWQKHKAKAMPRLIGASLFAYIINASYFEGKTKLTTFKSTERSRQVRHFDAYLIIIGWTVI